MQPLLTSRSMPCRIELEVEPAFVGLGPSHAAVGINNSVWIYRHGRDKDVRLVNKREYMGSVDSIRLNETHASVLTEGRIIMHPIEVAAGTHPDEFDMMLPPHGQTHYITCHAMTHHFIVTGAKQVGPVWSGCIR
jgi:WD repeat-containing protein 19